MLFRTFIISVLLTSVCHAANFEEERKKAEAHWLKENFAEYEKIVQKLSNQGDVRSQEWYGQLLWKRKKFNEAEQWLLKAASTGDAPAQYRLGSFYWSISPPKESDGNKWLKMAAEQGENRAKVLLSVVTSPPPQIRVKNGRPYTLDLINSNFTNLKKLLFSNEQFLACYKLNQEGYEKVFPPASADCTKFMLKNFGETISPHPDDQLEFSQTYSYCVRTLVLRTLGITEEELVRCTRLVR